MRSIVVGTAGHVDHGKSALVKALTGTDPDRLKEEQARGITIDLGFAYAAVGDTTFAFVDVPGHERFVKNMLAGVGGIDVVLLVVAADESVMPQTREHFDICRLLRVRAGVVALTKADLVDEDTLAIARLDVQELVSGSFLNGAAVVTVSAKTGAGLTALRDALVAAAALTEHRARTGAARLPIDRVFSKKGFGTIVTGTLVSGTIGDGELLVMPGAHRVKVRGVQVHGHAEFRATAGQRTAVNLAGADRADVDRGRSVVAQDAFVETRVFDARVDVLRDAAPLRHGARVRFHQGTAEIIGRVGVIDPSGDPIVAGSSGFVRLRLESPAVIARGDRYILRSYSPSFTIAGGVIVDPQPARDRIRSTRTLERVRLLDVDSASESSDANDRRALEALLASAGGAAVRVSELRWRLGADADAIDARVREMLASNVATRAGDVIVSRNVVASLETAIVDALNAHHRDEPLSEGAQPEALRARVFRRGHPSVFAHALKELEGQGVVTVRDRVALTRHRVALSPDETRAHNAIDAAFRDGGLTPPDVGDLAARTGMNPAVVQRVIAVMLRQKTLRRIDAYVFHQAALDRLKADVALLKRDSPTPVRIDVAAFKAKYGLTRKFAIPLLEYLDGERVTRRTGEWRVVL